MKNKIYTLLLIALFPILSVKAQVAVSTDGSSADASAMLEVKSTDKGFLPPRMTEAQRDAISNPVEGLVIYQTDETTGLYLYDGSAWSALSGSDSSPGELISISYSGSNSISGSGVMPLMTTSIELDEASDVLITFSARCVHQNIISARLRINESYVPGVTADNYNSVNTVSSLNFSTLLNLSAGTHDIDIYFSTSSAIVYERSLQVKNLGP